MRDSQTVVTLEDYRPPKRISERLGNPKLLKQFIEFSYIKAKERMLVTSIFSFSQNIYKMHPTKGRKRPMRLCRLLVIRSYKSPCQNMRCNKMQQCSPIEVHFIARHFLIYLGYFGVYFSFVVHVMDWLPCLRSSVDNVQDLTTGSFWFDPRFCTFLCGR